MERYALAIVESVRQPLILLSTDLTVVAANAAFYRVFATQRFDVVGRRFLELAEGAWAKPGLEDRLRAVLAAGSDLRDFEITHTFSQLGRRTFLLDARKLASPDGASQLILVGLEDHTSAAAAAIQSRQEERELHRSNRELEEFASVASHDLQEPLRKIRAFGERLALRAGPALDETSRDFLDRMLNASTRMSKLIDDVLRVSRIGQDRLVMQPVNLGELLREIVGDDPTVTIGPMPTLAGDWSQLHQLFQNLVENARKFVREDVPRSIEITATRAGAEWRVAVADNGLGIAPEHREKIFGMFRRLHGHAAYTGNGIGLALARRVAERHGGRIEVESVPGQGSTFIVVLPADHAGEQGS